MKDSYYKGAMEKHDEHSNEYDIYLSYCEEDKSYTDHIIECLKKSNSNIRIFSTIQELDMEESWQEQLYDTITSCKRVIALISSPYLKSIACTEQYNIALCHSRKLNHSVLIPLYLSDVSCMPTYMGITQYIDCRVNDKQKIAAACVSVLSQLTPSTPSHGEELVDRLSLLEANYDVFLSYSHFNEDIAQRIMKELRVYQPDINIFIDTSELKVGGAWQQALYEALDRSKVTIALISNHYLHSKVCLEELSLAIALQSKGISKVWPIIIELLDHKLEWLNLLSPVEYLNEDAGNSVMARALQNIVRDISEPTDWTNEQGTWKTESLTSLLEDARSLILSESQFKSAIKSGLTLVTNEQDSISPSTKSSPKIIPNQVDIYIVSSKEDAESCQAFSELVISHNQSLLIKKSLDESSSARLDLLENARLIIPLLSGSFMECAELVHELNIAWCRQRYAPDICFFAIALNSLPDKPMYVNVFPCFFNCIDKQWKEAHSELAERFSTYEEIFVRTDKLPLEVLHCFTSAIELLLRWMNENNCPFYGLHDRFTNVLHFTTCVQRYKKNSLLPGEKKTEELEPESTD